MWFRPDRGAIGAEHKAKQFIIRYSDCSPVFFILVFGLMAVPAILMFNYFFKSGCQAENKKIFYLNGGKKYE